MEAAIRPESSPSPWWKSPAASLGVLIAAGCLLRGLLVLAWRPGFLGYPDAAVYLEAARGKFGHTAIPNSVFFDRMRPAGYPIFLRILHGIDSHLVFAILAQHALGIASAVLLFAVVRRAGVSPWLGLVPAAAILLGGTEIFVEHSALTEALYVFLQSGALYAALRSVDSRDPGWAALAGGLIGAAADVRFLGIALVPVVAVWIGTARGGPPAGRLLHGGAALAAAGLLIGSYVYAQHQATGFTGLTQAGQWNLYGRVAPFADCARFTPPPGTRVLCETRPPAERPGPEDYIFGSSPATRAFGFPDWGAAHVASTADSARVAAFAHAVILSQPLDYLQAVVRDTARYISPTIVSRRFGDGLTPGGFMHQLTSRGQTDRWLGYAARPYFETSDVRSHRGLLNALKGYERWTRFSGVAMILGLLLALTGPFLLRGRARAVGVLLGVSALVLMLGPTATIFWDARLALPVYGVLAAAAALGASAVWRRVARPTPAVGDRAARTAGEDSPFGATSRP